MCLDIWQQGNNVTAPVGSQKRWHQGLDLTHRLGVNHLCPKQSEPYIPKGQLFLLHPTVIPKVS